MTIILLTLGISTVFYGQNIIFTETFDAQPDWHSGLPENDFGNPSGLPDRVQRAATHTFPNGWYSCYQDPRFSPSMGYPGKRETISILAADSTLARGGIGKCYVGARDSYDAGWNNWNSDGSLTLHLPGGYDQLYVEFWLKFSPDWITESGSSKIFRIVSWNGQESEYDYFGGGNGGPILIWNWVASQYGQRNQLAFRGGPHGDNYNMDANRIPGLPRGLAGMGDLPMNWTQDMVGMGPDGTTPQIPDKVNGGYISDDLNQTVTHDQVFGDDYNKFGFFVKMNSAPGINDGVCKQWFNGQQIFSNEQIAWVGPTNQPMPKWNDVGIGGNDFFRARPNAEAYQDWYAIDDVKVYDSIPAILTDVNSSISSMDQLLIYPNPASESLTIQYPSGFKKYQLQVIDALGQVVYNEALSGGVSYKGNYTKQLDVSTFRKGIYMINIQTESGNTVKRIAIQ